MTAPGARRAEASPAGVSVVRVTTCQKSGPRGSRSTVRPYPFLANGHHYAHVSREPPAVKSAGLIRGPLSVVRGQFWRGPRGRLEINGKGQAGGAISRIGSGRIIVTP